MTDHRGGDPLGIAPLARATETAVDALSAPLVALGTLLMLICKPAAKELGLYFQDGVRAWRRQNVEGIARKTSRRLSAKKPPKELTAHPAIVHAIVDGGSWTDDDGLQELWAGLLMSSCTEDGKDVSNQKFADLLKRITPSQARLLEYVSREARKRMLDLRGSGWIIAVDEPRRFQASIEQLLTVTRGPLEELDMDIEHLRNIGLIEWGSGLPSRAVLMESDDLPPVNPTPFALHFIARCNGERDVAEFYALEKTAERGE